MTDDPYVSVAVEGESDTGMARALLESAGLALSRPCLVKRGVANLDSLLPRLSRTKIHNPWLQGARAKGPPSPGPTASRQTGAAPPVPVIPFTSNT